MTEMTQALALALAILLLTTGGATRAQPVSPAVLQPAGTLRPRLGQPVSPVEAAAADLTVFADGRGLPPGRGTAAEGQPLYDRLCAVCHGPGGAGGSGGRLVGRGPLSASPTPDRTIGQYWPHATTVFDYTRRAMPYDRPGTLSADETYALTAWLLHANGVIGADAEMNALTLPAVRMPNRAGFVRAD